MGTELAKDTIPVINLDWVHAKASHDKAEDLVQEPMRDTLWPMKK
jgi:hypothetical protein